MLRTALFLTGLAIILLSLPQVLEHHARATFLNSAWCSSSGAVRGSGSIFTIHCAACPALFAGMLAVLVSPFAGRLRMLAVRGAAK